MNILNVCFDPLLRFASKEKLCNKILTEKKLSTLIWYNYHVIAILYMHSGNIGKAS